MKRHQNSWYICGYTGFSSYEAGATAWDILLDNARLSMYNTHENIAGRLKKDTTEDVEAHRWRTGGSLPPRIAQ